MNSTMGEEPSKLVRLLDTRTNLAYDIRLTDVQQCKMKADINYAELLISKAIRMGAKPVMAQEAVNGAYGHSTAVSPQLDSKMSKEQEIVWTIHRATRLDDAATLMYIQIMKDLDMKNKLKQKKALRECLYVEVCKRMLLAGFKCGENIRDGAERCKSKFVKLKKMYFEHSMHLKTCEPGLLRKKQPKYYDEVREFFEDDCALFIASKGFDPIVEVNNSSESSGSESPDSKAGDRTDDDHHYKNDQKSDDAPDDAKSASDDDNKTDDYDKSDDGSNGGGDDDKFNHDGDVAGSSGTFQELCATITRKMDEESEKQDVRCKRLERILLEQNKNLCKMIGLLDSHLTKGNTSSRKRKAT